LSAGVDKHCLVVLLSLSIKPASPSVLATMRSSARYGEPAGAFHALGLEECQEPSLRGSSRSPVHRAGKIARELDLAEAVFAAGLFRDISEFERVSKVLAGATKSAQR
jgi:hypothetical protein